MYMALSKVRQTARSVRGAAGKGFDTVIGERGPTYRSIARREAELLVGVIFMVTGLMNFSSDRYCDGNPADYFSCTNPTTYYYYDWVTIALVTTGAMLIVLWWLRHRVGEHNST
jgi:hypothetical protein